MKTNLSILPLSQLLSNELPFFAENLNYWQGVQPFKLTTMCKADKKVHCKK